MRSYIRAASSKYFLILWRGSSKADPRPVFALAQGRKGFPRFVVAVRESTGLIIASRKLVKETLTVLTIIFLSELWLRRGTSLFLSLL